MFIKTPFARISKATKVVLPLVVFLATLLIQSAAHAQMDPPTEDPPEDGTLVVGLVDTGVNTDGNDLNVRFDLGTDYLLNSDEFFDGTEIQHGTTSALIIDQESPGVAIAPLKVTDANFFTTQEATDAAILAAAQNSSIRVLSVSEGFKGFSNTMVDVSDAGKFISIQSGNGSSDEPNELASSHYALPGVVIVGAADGDGGLLPQSNRAGVTAERYVVAPGVTEFSPVFGTSLATARIAGIGAAVLEQNPTLTGEDVAQVILQSAEDRGDPGVDAEWGHGFIQDAEQVLSSIIGLPTVPTPINGQVNTGTGGSGGGGSSTAAGGLVLGAVVGGVLLISKGSGDQLEKTLILDSYGRPFEVDLRDYITVADRAANVSSFFDSLDEQYGTMRGYTGLGNSFIDLSYSTFGSEKFEFNRHMAIAGDVVWADRPNTEVSFSFAGGRQDGLNYRVNYNRNPHTQFASVTDAGARGIMSHALFLSGQTFVSPALGFSSRADSVSIAYPLTEDLNLQMGAVSVDEKQEFGLESSSTLMQLEYLLGERGAVNFQLTQLDETHSLFGGSNGGAYGVERSQTWALNITGHYRLTERFALIGNFGQGFSSIDDAEESLLHNFSNVRSEWFGLGLITQNLFAQGDKAGIAWSQPMKITSGMVDYTIPYALDAERNVLKNISRISLESEDAERKLEAYYRFPLGQSAEAGTFLMMRSDPNHVLGAKTDYSAMVTLRLFM